MRSKKFRDFLCLAYIALCVMVFSQQSFAGTWTDAFEDNNTRGWKAFNNPQAKWWVDKGEAVCETFVPNSLSIFTIGEVAWRNYSFSCKAKLVNVKADQEPATFGVILHQRWEENTFYRFQILYPWKLVSIIKMSQEGASTLDEFDFAAKLDTWYTLTASIDSRGKLEFKIDDVVFTAVDRDPIKNGKAGFIVNHAHVRFDDVEITGQNIPDGGPGALSVASVGKLAVTWGALKYQ